MNTSGKIIMLATALLVLSSCSKIHSNNKVDTIISGRSTTKESNAIMESATVEKNIEVVPFIVDFAKKFRTFKDLMENAPSIFEGEVVSVNFFDFKTFTYTRTQIRVSKAYTSDIKRGEVLTVVELGGVTSEGAGTRGKIMVLPNSIPVLSKGDRILLFAKQTSFYSSIIEGMHYTIEGIYYGKFKINGDEYENFSPVDNTEEFILLKFTQLDLETAIKNKSES